jgi:hypothetical protein
MYYIDDPEDHYYAPEGPMQCNSRWLHENPCRLQDPPKVWREPDE